MTLVQIEPPGVDLDLRYATPDNLTGAAIYHRALCLLHADAAAALQRAVALAQPLGLRLRLFDGYRPVEAQWRLWQALPDPVFIADPRQGSNHSRGIAIDLTLADAAGRPLDLGTGFDDMTPQSHHARLDVAPEAQRWRLLLLGLIVAPFLGAYPVFVMKLMCFALFASAFNLLLGYTGLLSFGHAAFLGFGAYTAALFAKHIHPDPTLGLLVGTAAATLLGVVCSFSIMRGRMSSFCLMRYAWSAVPCGKARMSFESPFFATWNTLPAFQSVTV